MQFNFKAVKKLLGKVVYMHGGDLPDTPYVVVGYDHRDEFLQLQSLVDGRFISGLHVNQVTLSIIGCSEEHQN